MKGRHSAVAAMDKQGFPSSEPPITSDTFTPPLKAEYTRRGRISKQKAYTRTFIGKMNKHPLWELLKATAKNYST